MRMLVLVIACHLTMSGMIAEILIMVMMGNGMGMAGYKGFVMVRVGVGMQLHP